MKKFFKYLLIVLGIILAGLLIIGLVTPKKYDFTRSIWIKADRKTVWNQVAYWKNFNHWSPWYEVDTAMSQTLNGTDGEKGAKWSWKSKAAGDGNMLNTEVKPMDSRTYELRFDDFAGYSTCLMTLKDSAGGTTVTWGMKGDAGFLPSIFMFFMGGMEGAVGKDYNKGLEYLKKYCEAHPETAGAGKIGPVTTKAFPKTLFVQIRRQMNMDEYQKNASAITGELAGKLMAYIGKNKLQIRGTMYGIYYTWDDKGRKTDFSVAFPVDKEGPKGDAEVSFETLPAKECAMVDFWGNYADMGSAHGALMDWFTKEKKEIGGAVLEEYITDPGKEKDPAKWQTRVWYPIK